MASASVAYEDAWHETGRMLFRNWFDTLPTARQARQEELGGVQMEVVRKSIAAGDAARRGFQPGSAATQVSDAGGIALSQ